MALAPLPNLTLGAVVQQLDSGFHWFGSTIVYSFPTSTTGLIGTTELNTFSTLNANQQSKAILALGLWDDLISTSFVGGPPVASYIEFANTRLASVYAQAYYPTDGTVWFNSNNADLVTPVIGNHGFLTYIHEIGHALGLDHMGKYDGPGSFTPNSYQDSTVLSVMSYFGPSWGSGVANGEGLVAWADWVGADNKLYEPQTPMLNDVYAIQQIYGADPSTRTGNTVYGFHSTVGAASGGIYDFTSNLNPIMCIYDSSGIDTLDLSGWSTSSTISLVPGTFSSGNSMTNNISIAYSCVIENAIGGAGADVLVGNDYYNTLDGGGGSDTLTGGAGADTVFGGDGYDLVSYYSSAAAVYVDLNLTGVQISTGDASGDVLSGFEGIDGSNIGNDILIGDASGNWINGRGGHDYIVGGVGVDTLIGGDGYDSVGYYSSVAGVNVDLNLTGAQASTGDASGDVLSGVEGIDGSNTGNDILIGDRSGNWINGRGGDDYIVGGAGADTLIGGDGYDIVSCYSSVVAVYVDLNLTGVLTSSGDASGDFLSGFEGIDGSNTGNDVLIGDTSGNWINGRGGHDYIVGGAGADTLIGGDGFDSVGYYSSVAGVSVDLNLTGAQISTGDGSGDVLSGFEGIDGSNTGNDILIGDGSGNWINGRGGDDYILGGAGADALIGGDGYDIVSYYSSVSRVHVDLSLTVAQVSMGDASGDILSGFEGIDGSNTGNDVLIGNASGNWINGRGGDDYITGGAGTDTMIGGDGYDLVSYYSSVAAVYIDLNLTGAQISTGDASGDILSGFEGIDGSNSGNDVLIGDASGNWINGRGGHDYIVGGAGADTLVGGDGNDVFNFTSGFGRDVITDFQAGVGLNDSLRFSLGAAFDTYVEIMAIATQIGTDTVLVIDAADTITLNNVLVSALVADDFTFV
jgi:serralysin